MLAYIVKAHKTRLCTLYCHWNLPSAESGRRRYKLTSLLLTPHVLHRRRRFGRVLVAFRRRRTRIDRCALCYHRVFPSSWPVPDLSSV